MTQSSVSAPGEVSTVRIEALARRHDMLERDLASEMRRPLPCDISVRDLKRRKLKLKDEMARIDGVFRTLDRMPRRVGRSRGADS
jgi:hypothetical protein